MAFFGVNRQGCPLKLFSGALQLLVRNFCAHQVIPLVEKGMFLFGFVQVDNPALERLVINLVCPTPWLNRK